MKSGVIFGLILGLISSAALAADKKFSADSLELLQPNFKSPAAVWYKGSPKNPNVFVWFHGGMQSSKCAKGYEAGAALLPFLEKARGENIVASVSACREHHWLSNEAMSAVDQLLDTLERRWKLKIDTVSLVGVSDGGLGILSYSFVGKRAVKARLLVSTNLSAVSGSQNFYLESKLQRGSWTFLQGGSDRLYPAARTVPWIEAFCQKIGPKNCRLRFDEKGEHDWSWWTAHQNFWIQEFLP